MDLEAHIRRLEARAASMRPDRPRNLFNIGTAAIWFGWIVFAFNVAWTLWDFGATLDTESLLIGANGFFGAALSMIGGVLLRTAAAALEIARRSSRPAQGPR